MRCSAFFLMALAQNSLPHFFSFVSLLIRQQLSPTASCNLRIRCGSSLSSCSRICRRFFSMWSVCPRRIPCVFLNHWVQFPGALVMQLVQLMPDSSSVRSAQSMAACWRDSLDRRGALVSFMQVILVRLRMVHTRVHENSGTLGICFLSAYLSAPACLCCSGSPGPLPLDFGRVLSLVSSSSRRPASGIAKMCMPSMRSWRLESNERR